MAVPPRASRIALWSLAFAGLAAAFALLATYRPSLMPASVCEPLPRNITKMSGAMPSQKAAETLGSYGNESAKLKAAMRPGDTVHEFETGVTGGHLVLRGKCYIGQAVSWIR